LTQISSSAIVSGIAEEDFIMNTATCKKCGVEHDIRDMRNGVCFWCEQKEEKENQVLQSVQYIYNFNTIHGYKFRGNNAK